MGRRMQVKIVRTFVFIFVTCLLRSALSFFGIISASQDFDNPCSANQCDACKNESSHIIFWILYTPALQMLVMLVYVAVCAFKLLRFEMSQRWYPL